jgi:hypothetical protein
MIFAPLPLIRLARGASHLLPQGEKDSAVSLSTCEETIQ